MLPEVGALLDAGTGLYRMAKYRQTDRLQIFLSHAHLDHIAGLTYLLNLVPEEVLKHTVVHAEKSKIDAVREHLFAESIFPVPPQFHFQPLDGPCDLPGGGKLTYFPLKHPGGCVGYRLDWPNHSLAYVTDTTADSGAAYLEKIRGVDLLLHEAYFADEGTDLPAITGHSSLLPVPAVAAAAGVKRLVLVHTDPLSDNDSRYDLDAARRIFPNTEIGCDCMELDF
jgi:ribonuclease BN (tRNA processing enzyme)